MNPDLKGQSRASRFLASLPASIEIGDATYACRAHDLSRSGVLMVGEMPVPRASRVRLTIGSSRGDLNVVLTGSIRRADRDAESDEMRVAVEFGAIEEDARATLESLIARAVEGVAPAPLVELPPDASPAAVRAALDRVPLSHRIALALRGIPSEREFLMQDPHLQVIDAVARNPGLLLHEVLRILRMPRVLPQTLEAIGRETRWAGNEQARVLVITHRNTPLGVAERLMADAPRSTLQKLIQAPDLKPALRSKVLRRLASR